MMVIHMCRKFIFVDISVKVGVYAGGLFIGSLIADFLPIPHRQSYLARKDNILNLYFVKLAWGWTLIVVGAFLLLTSYTYCCGEKKKIQKHMSRILVGTGVWLVCTRIFAYIESHSGMCSAKSEKYQFRDKCLASGYKWYGFDLSGHAFLLVYCSLLIIEEAKAILGWEVIRDMIRNEEYKRNTGDTDETESFTTLGALSAVEFEILKESYEKFTPIIRGLFIVMTVLVILWDVMICMTILYFHIMIEKFISGAVGILMWFLTYKLWYHHPVSPGLPGDGLFRYINMKQNKETLPVSSRRHGSFRETLKDRSTREKIPTFMGMPIYRLKNQEYENKDKYPEEMEQNAATCSHSKEVA